MRDYKDVQGALRMANRTGIIINDTQVSRLMETSIRAKERFKQLQDIQSFDASELYTTTESILV